jgi:AcrR family transcriptional regulator
MARQRVRRQPRAQTREELLDAAARVIARRGFHGASVEAVSEEAGFSTGALYSNFAGKEALFLTLYEERVERRRRELRELVARSDDPEAGLGAAAANVSSLMDKDRDWFLLYFEFVLHAAREPAFAKRFAGVRDDGLAELASGIADGLSRAGVASSVDADQLARSIRALTYGLALDRLVGAGTASDVDLSDVLPLIFRGAIAGAP